MGKIFKKAITRHIAFVIVFCFMFQIVIMTISNQYVYAMEINAFQKFMVEALHLRDTPRNNMTDELDEYFMNEEFDINVIAQDIQNKYFSNLLTYNEAVEALTVFSERSEGGKLGLYALLYEGAYNYNRDRENDCANILGVINEAIIGDAQNPKGISTLITLFKGAEKISGGNTRVFARNGNPVTDIEFVFEGKASDKSSVSEAMNHFTSLVERLAVYGSNNFDNLLSFAEETVNSVSKEEIKAFKYFLKDNGIYEGDPEEKPPVISPGPGSNNGGKNPGPQDKIGKDQPKDTTEQEGDKKDTEQEKDTDAKPTIAFKDIDHIPWAIESINVLAQKGVISGMGDGIFAPDDNVTREQFIRMIVYAFDLIDEEAEADFFDVDKEAWYYKSIASAKKHGITEGVGDGSFGVGREITRQDMCVMLYRLSQQLSIELPETNKIIEFIDADDIAEYANVSIRKMQQAGILNGVGENRFAPLNNATRAQAARVIYLMLSYN